MNISYQIIVRDTKNKSSLDASVFETQATDNFIVCGEQLKLLKERFPAPMYKVVVKSVTHIITESEHVPYIYSQRQTPFEH